MNTTLRLSDLKAGDRARVTSIQAEPAIRQRLQEMGLTRGETLVLEKVAPLGDPMELLVRSYHLSLRREEGACIFVEKEG
ncbi:FeoA family protein [Holophaga foetida]|uniref:FeoA family protein n=1 Tax=Holophaga foetida TaxID=35839 RepID=UPI00024717E4|nr:FeoA family protein [Holophaga foetida]